MGRPLWSPPPGKLDKPPLPTRCDPTTLPVSISHFPPPNPSRSTPSTWAQDYSPSSSSSSSSSSSGVGLRHSRLTDEDQQRRSLPRGDGMVMRSDSSMLTLDEFLRETSAASATRDEAERHLNNLLSLRRRMGAERPGADARRSEWPSVSTEPDADLVSGSASWRALIEHTPAGRARILGTGYDGRTGQVGGLRPVPYTYTPLPANGLDSFDTLVGQIRRIGALQDFMLSSVGEATIEDPVVATTSIAEAAPEEENTGTEATGTATRGSGEEGERNAVAALRVREARLRAMQTRIDLLASEFALLRNTRRELRRVNVEAEALSTLQTASARNTAAVAALTTIPSTSTARNTAAVAALTTIPSTSTARTQTEALSIFQSASARNTAVAATLTLPSRSAATQAAVDRYVSSRRTLPERNLREGRTGALSSWTGPRRERAEWGRQGSGNRDGDGEEGVGRWTISERDRVLRREVLQMQIESLPAGGI